MCCGLEKIISEFYSYDPSYCKSCIKSERKNYYRENKKEIIRKQVTYQNKRYSGDLNFKIRCSLRGRISKALKNGKAGSAVKDLGCTVAELRSYLEKQFQGGMSWNNYGDWHIDHILPLASFDLSDRRQFLKACHFTNLQPLWKKDNLKKGANINFSLDKYP